MPKQLFCPSPERFEWREYEDPELEEGQVLIHSQFSAAKHGTEMAFHKGYAAARGRFDREYQLFMPVESPGPGGGGGGGNMTVGKVVAVGPGVTDLAAGDRVLTHGGFRQTHIRPEERCWKLPEDFPWTSAVCLDPADFAMGAVRDGHVRVGDGVAIFGMGAIGLMAVQIARVGGASPIIAVEPLKNRRAVAGQVGADVVLDPTACDAGLEIKKATGGRGADVMIEYSGARPALQAALRGVAYGGTVVAGAFPPPYDAGLDLGAEAHLNVPNIVFSRSCSEPNRDHPRWDEARIFDACMRLLLAGKISGEKVVTPVVSFEDLLTEYPKIATEPDVYIKLGAEY